MPFATSSVTLTTMTPFSVENDGGYSLTLTGLFKDATAVVEFVSNDDPLLTYRCYSGVSGNGYLPRPVIPEVLRAVSPPMPPGLYKVRVTQGAHSAEIGPYLVYAHNWREKSFTLKRSLPPWYATGRRRPPEELLGDPAFVTPSVNANLALGGVTVAGEGAVLASPLPSDYWHESDGNYTANQYGTQPSVTGTGAASYSTSSGFMDATAFFVGRLGRTISSLGVEFVSAPGTGRLLWLGIYDCLPPSSHNVYPQALRASASFIPANTPGVQRVVLPSPVELLNGLYWIAFKQGNASGLQWRAMNSVGANTLAGGRGPLQWNTTTLNSVLRASVLNGDPMPATFPAGATMLSLPVPNFEVR